MPTLLFTRVRVFRSLFWFAATVLLTWGAGRFLTNIHLFAAPPYFPFNMFAPRLQSVSLWIAAALVWLAGRGVLALLARARYPFWGVCAAGLLLVFATNALQGVGPHRAFSRGFAYPVSGQTGPEGIQYYHDAKTFAIISPVSFLRNFNQTQPRLHDHGRTHPPGAILLFAALIRATGDRPVFTGSLLAAFSVLVSAGAMNALAKAAFPDSPDDPAPPPAALVFLCLPAVQIYFCATLDGVVAALLLTSVALACQTGKRGLLLMLFALCAFAASFLTFGAVWVVPVLGVLAWRHKTLLPFIAALGGAILAYLLLYHLSGFNYLAALQTASRLENPHGFRLFFDPAGYAATRGEDIVEIAAFAGPFVSALVWCGLKGGFRQKSPDAFWLFVVAVGTLAALFLTGAYRTGETARACLFVYPFLLLPVISAVRNKPRDAQMLLLAFWTQTVLMQTIGDYFW